jgi:D-3-phosphoglycerate dehydrogenase / 2-oxoglutarate reductase
MAGVYPVRDSRAGIERLAGVVYTRRRANPDHQNGASMTRPSQVYVLQGRGQRDYADAQAALAHVPATVTTLPFTASEDEIIARTRDADAVITSASPITRGVMSALEGLKTVVRTGVGYDVIDVRAATELGVIVVNVPDIWVREVANHALALLLAWNRKIVTLDRQVHAGVWSSGVPGPHTGALHGETVGIVGLGNIGSAFARRVAAFETTVIACDPYVEPARFAALGVERVSLEQLAERADYVSVHTLLNAETRHLIGAKFFQRTKPTAILINTSRGPVVDEQALYQALQDKRLAGAALDVWEQEPVAADHPLLKLDSVIATPHAAYFSTPAVAQVPRRCGEEVARVLTGQRPLNVVNPELYAPGAVRRAR